MTTKCYHCEADVTFSDEYISEKTGRRIPLDAYTMGPHQCPMYKPPRKYKPCNNCEALIYFDKDAPKSVNDRWVPQDKLTGEAHQCPESDYNKKNSGTVPATTMTN